MDWLDKMNAALDYVENNLVHEVDFNIVAQKACCSSYNFQRMFSFITGVTLSEYIRRRRLTLAALELQNVDVKIIDLALKYGYDSPVSFSRAFLSLHQLTPTNARKYGATLKAYPRISFQISIKGESEMDYRIETKEAFSVFGIETISSTTGDEDYLSPQGLWQKTQANGEYERLFENSGDLPSFVSQDLCKIHGVCGYRDTGKDTFPYLLCSFVSPNSKTDGYTVVQIPAHTWAIFPSERFTWDKVGETINNLYKRFYSEWLPTSGYEQIEGADFEIYGGDTEMGYIELWYPVKKKK